MMKPGFYKKYILTALLAAMLVTAIPREAAARNIFRQFFHDIKRATGFIVKLPDKATRWMGPVLGPIASAILTQNIAGHHKFGQLFSNVRRANNVLNDIEEQRRLTGEVRRMYRDQAGELRGYANKLEEARETLRGQLTSRDVDLRDYIQTAIELDRMIATVKETADRFEANADRIDTGDIVRLAAGNLAQNVIGEIKNASLQELNNEILDVINPDIIRLLTDQNSRGLDALLDMYLSGERDKYDGKFDWDELRDRVRDRIRDILADNKENLEGNIKDQIGALLAEIAANMNAESGELREEAGAAADRVADTKPPEKINPYGEDELAASLADIPQDEFGCRPGYEWRRMSGVGCVQKDCAAAGGHYSYTEACICAFIDSKPGDKTKICMRPANYLACPSCVYACVTPDEECPER